MQMPKLTCAAVACCVLGLAGCARDDGFDQLFSPVYKDFRADVLTAGGTAKLVEHKDRGSWNPKTRRGSKQIRGILSADALENPCDEILKFVDQFVQQRTGKHHIEGDIPSSVNLEQKHAYTMWMYNWEKRHGELHIWLFPYPDGKRIGFAVHHYEEDLK